jgi:uncharacterized protein (UPF0332 family)
MIKASNLDLSKYRLDKAKELLNQSEIHFSLSNYDESIDCSCSAIFNAARSLLALISLDSHKHTNLLSYFDRYFITSGICDNIFSQITYAAFEVREIIDYEEFYLPTFEETQQLLENAKMLIEEVEIKRQKFIKKEIQLPVVDKNLIDNQKIQTSWR